MVPRIYARFDIVWPDVTGASTEPKTVDALTYGLSTLTLGSRFASTTRKAYWPGGPASPAKFGGSGNSYARYIKKFSLGNGPPDWVAEYMICKEGGKMLGTLVALAVAKMKNLETFIWDMPTGVLSDVFMALSSLGDQPNGECRLNSVRVRWHNKLTEPDDPPPPPANLLIGPMGRPVLPPGSRMTPIGIMLPDTAAPPRPHSPYTYANYICEYPTLSVLPPLRSLTGLDIDELVYLDEMAILIERSKDLLKELRVGISIRAADRDFSQTWDGPDLKQMDPCARWPGASRIGQRRLGGVLGVIFSHIYDIRKQEGSIAEGKSSAANAVSGVLVPGQDDGAAPIQTGDAPPPLSPRPRERLAGQVQAPSALEVDRPASPGKGNTNGKLGLEILELERVSLSIHVLRYAIDWSTLTRLTLLDCPQHEDLWKMLHKVFRPTATASGRRYHLALKKIHTDLTTVALLDFLRETLEPNTLEVLFLQDRRRGISPSVVPLNLVWRAINRHHSSLQMLLLDSSAKSSDAGRWRAWCPNTSMMNWLTSGRMSSLTQLSIHLSYIDWVSLDGSARIPSDHLLTNSSTCSSSASPTCTSFEPSTSPVLPTSPPRATSLGRWCSRSPILSHCDPKSGFAMSAWAPSALRYSTSARPRPSHGHSTRGIMLATRMAPVSTIRSTTTPAPVCRTLMKGMRRTTTMRAWRKTRTLITPTSGKRRIKRRTRPQQPRVMTTGRAKILVMRMTSLKIPTGSTSPWVGFG